MPTLSPPGPFAPPRWLRSAHLQTLGAALPLWTPRGLRAGTEERLRIPLPGGGALLGSAWWGEGVRPAVVLVHGVGGSERSQYVVRAAAALLERGYHAVRLNLRGAGEGLREARQLYHGGLTEDLHVTAALLAADPRVSGVALLGFSLGGNAALKAASEQPAGGPIQAVAAVSAPLDLAGASRNLGALRNLPYRVYILRSLVAQARQFAALYPEGLTFAPRDLGRVRTVWEYDDVVVAPMHGFGTAQRYYEASSAGPRLGRIAVPGLLVHAADDPMVPGASVAPWMQGLPENLETAWSERGGHVGFFGGLGQTDWSETWALSRTLGFLARALPPSPG